MFNFEFVAMILMLFSVTQLAQARCVQLYENNVYVGCRVYDEQREIGFDSSQVKAPNCFSLCQHWEAILAGTAPRKIQEPRYSVPTQLGKKVNEMHAGLPHPDSVPLIEKLCGLFTHGCHIGNPKGDLSEKRGAVYAQVQTIARSFIQLDPKKEYLRRVLQVSVDGTMIETLTPIGEKHYFKVLGRSKNGDYRELKELPPDTVFQVPNEGVHRLADRLINTAVDLLRRDLELPIDEASEAAFVEQMVQRHMGASLTLRNDAIGVENSKWELSIERFRIVSRLVLKKVKDGTTLTERDLETWNRILIAGIPGEEEEDLDKFFQFIIRGNRRTEVEPDRKRRLNLNGSAFSISSLSDGSKTFKMLYIPSNEVPGVIKDVLERTNRIDRQSTLDEICQIYRDFIKAHPFINGNGRLGRFVMEFGLLKGGFISNTEPLPREIILVEPKIFKFQLSKTLVKKDAEFKTPESSVNREQRPALGVE